ncbi:hypothetical protein, variant 3 [Verruconis gallopava]|uniref:DUF202 domain-containing protein n=1 Tax=Verruconis gallopava TaxID=253628 RepID=A0A0D1XVE8_9PEZI|nr:hypothetical protein, variant 2 [Verruconis gallopava]XP_016216660.1 hypothetical protein, variant 3 [Verruconis gallopava]KIW06790.1 hypothetical protein, variant 2 [Verruconis gallopava]KIW06791.1 hypothetical protein, variant 3 [Verruconis gallopava]
MPNITPEEHRLIAEPYVPKYSPFRGKPVLVKQRHDNPEAVFLKRPWHGPLLFDNNTSDARDHCANERTFLSWLRLAVYMAVVSVAIMVSFHLKHQPTQTEKRLALPFGIIFWFLSLCCLIAGVSNYIRTVSRYSRQAALVQSGWKTEVVCTRILLYCMLSVHSNMSFAT